SEIDTLLAMPPRVLDLGIDAHVAAHRAVEARDQRELLIECRDSKQSGIGRESLRESSGGAARSASLRHRELLQLGEIEIDRVVTAVCSLPAGEPPRYVCDVV